MSGRLPMLTDCSISIAKMTISKVIYRVKLIPIKTPRTFLPMLKKKQERSQIVKTVRAKRVRLELPQY